MVNVRRLLRNGSYVKSECIRREDVYGEKEKEKKKFKGKRMCVEPKEGIGMVVMVCKLGQMLRFSWRCCDQKTLCLNGR